jgi:hypothetical protein
MTNALEVSEAEAAAIAKSPNRVSLASIEKKIVGEFYFRGSDLLADSDLLASALGLLTICVLVTETGFTFVGKSAPVEAANFNAEFGRKLAREDAIRQIWPMEGYLLRDKMTCKSV